MSQVKIICLLALICASSVFAQGNRGRGRFNCDLDCGNGICRKFFGFLQVCLCERGFDGLSCNNDSLAPTIRCPDDVLLSTEEGSNFTSINFEPTYVDDNDDASPTVSSVPASGSRFYFGYNSVRMVASDKAGNEGTCEFMVTVEDDEAPVLVCPDDLIYILENQEKYKNVQFIVTSVTDNVDEAIIVNSNPKSGSDFYQGANEVAMYALDQSGNRGSCTFRIIIQAPDFYCSNGTRIENSDVCNTVWNCQDGSDEIGCAPQSIDGRTIEHGLQYNATWRFQGPEELGAHVTFNLSSFGRLAISIGEGTSPGRNIIIEEDVYGGFDVHLPSDVIWITLTSVNSVNGTALLFVETSPITSPIHIEEGFVLINGSYSSPVRTAYIWKVTVPEDKWIGGTFEESRGFAQLKTRIVEGGPLVSFRYSFTLPPAFLFPINEMWIFQSNGFFVGNISSQDPQVIQVEDGDTVEFDIESVASVRCYEETWIIQLPESSQYAMRVSKNDNSSANIVFFEGMNPSGFPLGYFMPSQSSNEDFVTHVTNATITVVTFPDFRCYYSGNESTYSINLHLELKRENLNVQLGNGESLYLTSAQQYYTDNLILNRRIFYSEDELFLETHLTNPICSLLYLGESLPNLFSSNIQFPMGPLLLQSSTRNVGVLNSISGDDVDCPYSIQVHAALPSGYMVCPGSNSVVTATEVCDSEWNCPSGEDEFDCEPTLLTDSVRITVAPPLSYSSPRSVSTFTFMKERSDSIFFFNVTSSAFFSEITVRIGGGSYQGPQSDAIIILNNDQLSEYNQLFYFREDTIWIEVYADQLFEGIVFVGNDNEDTTLCSNSMAIIGAARCNGLHQCSSGDDEVGCAPLELFETVQLLLPDQRRVETITWSFSGVEGAAFFVTFDDSGYYRYTYYAIGRGRDPSDESSILVQWSSYEDYSFEQTHSFISQEIWIVMKPDYFTPNISPGYVETVLINDITVMEGFPANLSRTTGSENSALWVFRFPGELGCRIECEDVELVSSDLIFGFGEDLQTEDKIVNMISSYDFTEIQIPYHTVWVEFRHQQPRYYYTYGNDGAFNCRVMANTTTVNLQQDVETEIRFAVDGYNVFYWVGWTLVPPDSLASLLQFEDGRSAFRTIEVGTDVEEITTPAYQYVYESLGTILVNGSAWVSFSTSNCYGTCLQLLTVSAVDYNDILFCGNVVYEELDICDINVICDDGADETGCVTETLDQGDTISLPLPLTSLRSDSIDMIWSIIMTSGAQTFISLNGSLSQNRMLEFGSGIWQTGKMSALTVNERNDTSDIFFPWNSIWIRYRDYFSYYSYGDPAQLIVEAVYPDGIVTCDDSFIVLYPSLICDGQPLCPNGGDEIGCEITGSVATLQSTNYPMYGDSNILQRWEYFTKRENASIVVRFRALNLGYSATLYAGIGYISRENASVDYRPVAERVLTQYDPIQDLYLDSNRVWIVIQDTYSYGRGSRMWADVRVVDANEEILRCEDGRHLAVSDQLCDNIWDCDDGEDERGCEAIVIEKDDVFELMSQPEKTAWIFRLSSPADEVFALNVGNGLHSILRFGSGSNFNDGSLIQQLYPYDDNDKLIYISGMNEIWITLEGTSYGQTSVNLTVISRSELLKCGKLDEFIDVDKVCDDVWDCSTGLDESDCEPTYLEEGDEISVFYDTSMMKSTNSLTFEVPDGLEAVLTPIIVQVKYTGVYFGTGADPTNSSSRIYSVINSYNPELVVPGNRFWIKFIPINRYGRTSQVQIILRPLETGVCEDGEFKCTLTRECITSSQVCDGQAHCLDRSDETSCPCASQSAVRCGDGLCAGRSAVCARFTYGILGLGCIDELHNCDFKCPTSLGYDVINNMFICDGYRDCVDGSDEEVENCDCKPPAFSCGERCLSPNQVCDGIDDCNDGRDEDECECSSYELPCGDNECVAYWDGCMEGRCMDADVCKEFSADYPDIEEFKTTTISNSLFPFEEFTTTTIPSSENFTTTAIPDSEELTTNTNPNIGKFTTTTIPDNEKLTTTKTIPDSEELTTSAIPDSCSSITCQNGGICFGDGRGDYICLCNTPFNGRNCEQGEEASTDFPDSEELTTITIPDMFDVVLDPNEATILSSQNYLATIPRFYDVFWVISAPSGYGVQLDVLAVDIGYDSSITFGGGSNVGQSQIAELSRYSVSQHLLRSSTLWIQYSNIYNSYNGFSIKLSAVKDIGISNVWYLNPDEKVVVTSAMFPQDYPVKVDKVWNFHTLDGYGFMVKFTNFSLETNWDYVSLGSGVEPISLSKVAVFTGDNLPEDVLFSHDSMWMRFTSDLSRTSQGFRAEIMAVNVPSPDFSQTIRLVGGENSREGRVEILYNGIWGTICDDSWDVQDASVVCRQLGLGDNGYAFSNARFGQGSGQIWLDEVQCFGFERRLEDCRSSQWGSHDCGHYEDAGVQCFDEPFGTTSLPSSNSEGEPFGTTTLPSSDSEGVYSLLPNSPFTIDYFSSFGYDTTETWILVAPANHSILLSFNHITISTYRANSLTISVALPYTLRDVQIASYSGYEVPADLFIHSNKVTLTYRADVSYFDSFSIIATGIPDEISQCDEDTIPPDVKCDGRMDCVEGNDEDNCSESNEDNDEERDDDITSSGYLVQILYRYGSMCGGTLINSRWVLTSSVCIRYHETISNLQVQVGIVDFDTSENISYSVVAVIHITTNSGEDTGLSLLKLNETVDGFGSDIFSPCLPQNGSVVEPGNYVNIFGWAHLSSSDGATLLVSREPVVSPEYCNLRSSYLPNNVTGETFCTGYIQSYGADCYAVYGGPVVYVNPTSGCHEVIGIVVEQPYSWSCGQSFQPKVFPLVSSQVELMREIMQYV